MARAVISSTRKERERQIVNARTKRTTTKARARAANALEVVGRHEQLERDLGLDGELGNANVRVGVPHLVVEILDHLLQDGRVNIRELDLAGGLDELAWARADARARDAFSREGRRVPRLPASNFRSHR